MAPANQKIVLSRARDISFNKVVLNQANVQRIIRRSVEELA